MQATLVFAPSASPTYMPLGIATIAEYISSELPECRLSVKDLNIRLWNEISSSNSDFMAFSDFSKGKNGNFYDKSQYLHHQQSQLEISGQINEYLDECKRYLETDTLGDFAAAILRDQSDIILQTAPQLLGISVMYPEQVIASLALAKYMRTTDGGRELRIILGGATVSIMDVDEILRSCPFVDALFQGEGEAAFKMLCQNKPYDQIAGLCYRVNGKIVRNLKPDTLSLAQIPLPTFSGLDFSDYFNPEPVIPAVFSRGCKWRKCRFCAHNFSYSGYRKHDISRFVDYMQHMVRHKNAKHFYFADQYVDACDMLSLSEEIIARDLETAFHIMGRPTDDYTPEVLEKMSSAGCRWISWGVETGSQRLIDISNKGTSVETVKTVLRDTFEAGISNLPMMIYGLPTSTDLDMEITFDMIDDVLEYCDDFTGSSFKLFDKTAFAAQAAKYAMSITGREVMFSREGIDVHSLRLFFKELANDGTLRAPRGPYEADKWRRRKRMMGFISVFTDLCCEHYLLYAGKMNRVINDKPRKRPAAS